MPRPARAQTARISAKTPNGAAHSTQRTTTIIASAIAWKKPTMRSRWTGSIRVRAKPKNSANTTSGSIALSAAAAIALLGTIATSESAQLAGATAAPPLPAAPDSAWARSGSGVTSDSAAGATIAVKAAAPARISRNTMIARRATRPELAASLAVFTPTITSASTSGTTVICSALSHSLPNGCTMSATRTPSAGSSQASSRPSRAPETRPVRIREVALMASFPSRCGRGRSGVRSSGSSGFEQRLDPLQVGQQPREALVVAFAQHHEQAVQQVLQGRVVEQGLDVRTIVVRGHQQRHVRVRAQRVGGVPGDADHAPALGAEVVAELAQRRLLAMLGEHQQHVAGRRRGHARGHVRGVEVVHGEDAQPRQLQRERARMDVVLAQADDEHAAGRADRLGRRFQRLWRVDQAGRFLGLGLAPPQGRGEGALALVRGRRRLGRGLAVVGARQRLADRELEVRVALERELLAELDHAGLADSQRIGELLRGIVAQQLGVREDEVGDPALARRHLAA